MKKILLTIFIFLYSCSSNIVTDSNIETIDISNTYKIINKNYKIKNIADNDIVQKKNERKSLKLAKKKAKKERREVLLSKIKRTNSNENIKIAKKNNSLKKKKINSNQIKKKQKKNNETLNVQVISFDKNYSYDEYKKILKAVNDKKKFPDINIYE